MTDSTMTMPATSGYVSLHTHSEGSALDGLARITDLFARAAELGQTALAITDHGNLAMAWRAQQAADASGVKFIAGIEAYLGYGSRFDPGSAEVPADDGDDSDDSAGSASAISDDSAGSASANFDDSASSASEIADEPAPAPKLKTRRYMHLTLLATTSEGWHNLVRIRNASETTKVTVSGKPYPLIDYELIGQHADGIVALTGCLGGPVIGPVVRARAARETGDDDAARRFLAEAHTAIDTLTGKLGSDRVFVELMEHGLSAESAAMPEVAALAAAHGVRCVATNDSHYTRAEDASAHDAWLAVRTKKLVTDTGRYAFHGTGYHLRSEDEMRVLRDEPWWQEAVSNTVLVAGMCAARVLPKPNPVLPKFPTPEGYASNRDYLIARVREGAERLYGSPLPQVVRDRLNHELDVIEHPVPSRPELSFVDYMLLVDLALSGERDAGGLIGAGRGSSGGSAIARALGIIDVDPIEKGLLFERFLEPGRDGFPDIDSDVAASRREGVLDRLTEFWGRGHVALIGSFASSKAKRALRDAARVLGEPRAGDDLAKAVPERRAGLAHATDADDPETGEFRRALAKTGEAGSRVLNLARQFEDTVAGYGIHACGVVISDRDIWDEVPMRIHKDTGRFITEWDWHDVESYGLVKVDILALRSLDVVAKAIEMIRETTGETIVFEQITRGDYAPTADDPHGALESARVESTWRLLQEGRTSGIFQLESEAMRQLARDLKPTTENDLSALIALFRPGPLSANMHTAYARRKNGLEAVDYTWATSDPTEAAWLDTVLGGTFGLIVFQESMMRLGTVIAGFNASETSMLRKAVSKKKADMMERVGDMLVERAGIEYRDDAGNVYSPVLARSTAERVYEAIKGAAAYAFNASHSAAYARLSWQCAYLKANWPAQFGAAILASTDGNEKRIQAIDALTTEGVTVLAPDVNASGVYTAPTTLSDGSPAVRLGLSEIAGTGAAVATRIVLTRERSGPYASLHDLATRPRVSDEAADFAVSASDLAALIESGACDAFGPRMGLSMIARAAKTADLPVPGMEWGVIERSSRQRVRLLTVVGENPLTALQAQLKAWNAPGPLDMNGEPIYAPGTPIGMLPGIDGASVTALGLLGSFSTKTYRGGTMANLTLEGTGARIRCVMWDEAVQRAREANTIPPVGHPVGATGRIRVRELETENEDGTISTTTVRELTITSLHRAEVTDPSVGVLSTEGVTVPQLCVADERSSINSVG